MQGIEILNRLCDNRIVAIIRKIEKQKIEKVVQALLEGGINSIEITMDSDGTLELIKNIKNVFKNSMILGVGTVLDSMSCRMAIEAGAEFVVTPTVNANVIKMANMYGKPCISGAMTPTEILTAYEYGAPMIKVFPAATLGPSYFKEVSGPLGHIPLMATGGINIENIENFAKVGVRTFGLGSSLVNKKAVEECNFEKIKEDAAKLRKIILN